MNQVTNAILEPGYFKLDGGAMFGIIPKPLWNKVAPSDEMNRIDLALRLWLIQTNNRVIVIDTGIGDYHGDKFDQRFDVRNHNSPLLKVLSDLNLKPSDVTDLVLSHLHFDHVGGIGHKNAQGAMVPVFESATLHLHRQHYDYSLHPTDRDTGSFHVEDFLPIIKHYESKKQIHWLEGKTGDILELEKDEMLKFKSSMGHTPHLIHPYSSHYIYLADLIPTSNHVSIPWVMGYDIAPGTTTQDKKEILPFIHDNNLTIIFEHDPLYWGAKIIRDEKGQYKVGEVFSKKESSSYLL